MCTNIFLGQPPKAIELKTKINKLGLIKLTSFLHSKGNHKQNEKTTYKWENIFANHVTDKGLISKMYKQHIQLSNNKTTELKKNGQKT